MKIGLVVGFLFYLVLPVLYNECLGTDTSRETKYVLSFWPLSMEIYFQESP